MSNKFTPFSISYSLKILILAITASLLLLSCSGGNSSVKKSSILPLKIINTTIAKGIKESAYSSTPIRRSDVFSPKDKEVVSLITIANLTGTHDIRWDWYTPDNKLYQSSGNFALKSSKDRYVKEGSVSHSIDLKDTKAAEHLGHWKVEIFVDDSLAKIDDFTLQKIDAASDRAPLDRIDFGKYYGLIIGINNYKSLQKLKSANNDAREVAKLLAGKYNFTITLLLDATRSDIVLALDEIRLKLTENDNLLIYYAGHGILDDEANEGFWLAADASEKNTLNWISNHKITATLKAMRAKHVMVVADSCYAGKMVRNVQTDFSQGSVFSRGVGVVKKRDYFASMAAKKARTVLCSGGLEPVEDSDGKSGHSAFAAAFIDILNTNENILDGTELFGKLRRPVMLNADQTPEYSDIRKAGHDGGDFLFIPNNLYAKER